MKYIKLALAMVCVVLFIGCAGDTQSNIALDEDDIGLRNTPLTSEDVRLKDFAYISTPAGEGKVVDRSFENAPPMISHDVTGMMDITKDFNACISCHAPENAAAINIISVPASHTYDTFNDKKIDGIADSRYNCTLCHSPQANIAPIVGNTFKPDFRNESDKRKSNLLDILDEGVN
ncbi:hypothetical protein CCY99_04965 [Helicobacter sp. 16-1353]|uniref:nitrate reductase cytochrome c-type subunit n=1 Tax=Helicobacter sp. 16-1353 TaxID=2004996 RepID=UPI000DCBA206|nr:nitrate reductase cytochrome c-type subunit [Helicobacter sp. 16-1353]RAX54034.1 hypothetical protein CCY99_04965 [Helicobacter sp. 16-1353]